MDESAKSERAERMLAYWNEHESKIVYGGSQAYYSKTSDEIHLPVREDFYDMQEFYSTALQGVLAEIIGVDQIGRLAVGRRDLLARFERLVCDGDVHGGGAQRAHP